MDMECDCPETHCTQECSDKKWDQRLATQRRHYACGLVNLMWELNKKKYLGYEFIIGVLDENDIDFFNHRLTNEQTEELIDKFEGTIFDLIKEK